MSKQVSKIEMELRCFTGTEMYYFIPLLGTRYTDGLKYLANAADCYWLITDVSVIAKSLKHRSRWVTIDFKKVPKAQRKSLGYEAEIIYSDGNDNILERQLYGITDFLMDELRLFFVNDTLMLPSEY